MQACARIGVGESDFKVNYVGIIGSRLRGREPRATGTAMFLKAIVLLSPLNVPPDLHFPLLPLHTAVVTVALPLTRFLCCTLAVHAVVFGGFSADSLSQRILDSKSKVWCTWGVGARGRQLSSNRGSAALLEGKRWGQGQEGDLWGVAGQEKSGEEG